MAAADVLNGSDGVPSVRPAEESSKLYLAAYVKRMPSALGSLLRC